ncbi:GOLPH3/VPS74 family protein, partial [Marinitenerispora sediminis]
MPAPVLAEDLLVLAYHPGTGRPLADGTRLNAGLAGALLAELYLTGRIAIERDRVRAVDGPAAPGHTAGGHSELDLLVARIARQRRAGTLKSWVARAQSVRLRSAVRDTAVERGLLTLERVSVLTVFTRSDYRPADPAARSALLDGLRAVLMGERAPDPRSAALLALVGATRLDRRLFADVPARERRRRMKGLLADDRIGRAVAAVIQSVEAAVAFGAGGGDGGPAGSRRRGRA